MTTMRISHLIRLMRPKDWAKGIFVVIPFVFWIAGDGRGEESASWQAWRTLVVVASFAMVSGGFYAINDAVDVCSDRTHPIKRLRPVASGQVSVAAAKRFGAVLVAAGLATAAAISWSVLSVVTVYACLQVLYNVKLKRLRLVDVSSVASGFVLRSMAGALAIDIKMSSWLVVVVYALTMYLGFTKRLADLRSVELLRATGATVEWQPKAGYQCREELSWLLAITGSLTLLSYLLYALSDHARGIFGARAIGFALLTPLVLVVIHRLHVNAYLGRADSPVSTIMSDRTARIATMLYGACLLCVLFVPLVSRALGSVFQ